MLPSRVRVFPRICLALSVLWLAGCAGAPASENAPAAEEVPEISLSLPPARDCVCETAPQRDYNFLEKGFIALGAGELEEARQYFQRYRRLESGEEANWESSIALAYIGILPDNPERDVAAARAAYIKLGALDWRSLDLHPSALLLRQALENALRLENAAAQLQGDNAALRSDLYKREETIKRLRELTLGQTGVTQ